MQNTATNTLHACADWTDCPAWCTADHTDDDRHMGFVHSGEIDGYAVEVPDQADVELRFNLEQFVDTEAADAPVVVFNGDRYDEEALWLLARLCATHADLLRSVQSAQDGR